MSTTLLAVAMALQTANMALAVLLVHGWPNRKRRARR